LTQYILVLHVPLSHLPSAKHKASHCTAACKARSTTKWGCALRVVERRPLFCNSVVKDQISACRTCISASHFQSAKHILNAREAKCLTMPLAIFRVRKHIFKASVACNGREVLHGTPEGRHGISAIEAADRASDHEPTIHWQVSRTSAACRVGSRKHLSPSAMRSEPVGRTPGAEVSLRLARITCPLTYSEQNGGCVQ